MVFRFHRPITSDYLDNNPVERFWGEEGKLGPDRVILIEDGDEAKLRRLNLIENAQNTIDISYYSFHDSLSTDIFTAAIMVAADRGVKIRFILDGIANFRREELQESIYTFTAHENIEFKYYEPINGIKPWTWNNRLHDKIIIVDQKWAIIGGRNIGDKYFDRGEQDRLSHDRDVFIMNTDLTNSESAVYQMEEYYEYLWNHKFSSYPMEKLSTVQSKIAQDRKKFLQELLNGIRKTRPELFAESLDWMDESTQTNKVTFIHNPLTRFNKEPWVWYEITRLMEAAQSSIIIQSPYVIPNKRMLGYIDLSKQQEVDVVILTNSFGSNPNTFGLAGYMKFRKDIIDFADYVYEYQGIGSLHAKSFIFDHRISMIGTFNTDPRSAFLSTESMVVIDSEEFTAAFRDRIEDLLEQSLLAQEDYTYVSNSDVEELPSSLGKRVKIRILSMLTYFFDYLL
ncbi:phospholipase D family protein [Alkalicella caledoniensis]|uniref:Phospholipase D family protein n=1 Tax=Alkalicella caledoniensis TaxID=2731377 RepID=A0A7G9WBE4_ALKCA|nr:phospholipase D family protein [Alkalicella caledoniensis]